jgi:hypothetical protein
MTDRSCHAGFARGAAHAALGMLALALAGCADMSDNMTAAFADPAKYELYDCKQLEAERKGLAARAAELQGLMAKAETGFAGPVVAQVAYSNDYIAVRGQSHFAEEAWRKNNCHESPPAPAAKPLVRPQVTSAAKKPLVRSRSETSVY